MEIKIIIDRTKPESVTVVAHERNQLIDEIERLISENNLELIGYKDNEAQKINLINVSCFISENNKTYALAEERLQIKLRLYQIEDMLDANFIRINQSCIANIRQIEKVEATFSGFISVIFKNGYRDYISRRNLKNVKERLGVKL